MSPNQIKQKAQKYYDAIRPIFVASSLHARNGANVHLKHKTIRDLLAFLGELAGAAERSEGEANG